MGRLLTLLNNGFNGPRSLPNLKAWLDVSAPNSVYQDGAAHFTAASSQYLSCASNSSLQMGASDFTLCGWFKFDSLSASRPLISKWGSSGPLEYIILTSGTQVFFYISTSSSLFFVGEPATLSTNTWYFICAWSDGTNLNIQLNNGAVSQTAFTGPLQTGSSPLYLGYDPTDGFYNDGSMDSLFITKRVLTSAERTALYNAGAGQTYSSAQSAIPSIFDSYAVSWYDCDEESGTRFDAIGSNHLTASNTTLIAPGTLNGGFETAGATPPAFANWSQIVLGTGTLTRDTTVFDTGSASAKFVVDAGNDNVEIQQSILRVGDKYTVSLRAKGASGGETVGVGEGNPYAGGNTTAFTLTTSWASYSYTFTSAVSTYLSIRRNGAGNTFNIDNVTLTDLGPVGIAGIAAGLAQDGNFCASGDGTSQGFYLQDTAYPDMTTEDFYISFFFYPNRLNNFEKLISFNDGATLLYADYIVGSGVRFTESATGATVYAPGTNPLNLESWGQLECWYNHTAKTLNIRFNNGTKASVATTFTPNAGTPTLTLMSASGVFFGGRFDNCRVSNFIPSDADATTAWNNGKGMKYAQYIAAGLPAVTAAYDFDKIIGIAADSTGNGLTLANQGSTGFAQGVNYFGGAVRTWKDQSGNNANLTQTVEASRPLYYTGIQNGKASILYNGASNYLSGTIGTVSAATGCTFINIFSTTVTTQQDVALVVGGDVVRIATEASGGNKYEWYDSVGAAGVNFAFANLFDGNLHMGVFTVSGTTLSCYMDGALVGTGACGNFTLTNPTYSPGLTYGSAGYFNGYIPMNLVYGATLSAGQIAQFWNYVRNYYAL